MTITDSAAGFVSAKKVFFDYTQHVHPLAQLIGKQAARQSVLREVTFSLPHGAHVVLFGSEAAGKTTLMRLLAGLLKPTAGHLTVNGKSPYKLPGAAAGYVSAQKDEKHASKSPQQILQACAKQHHATTAAARLQEIAEIVKLGSCIYRPLETLTTSERIRFNIARAALSDPPLILLDDSADVVEIKEVKRLLVQLWAGRTVIIATRFSAFAEELALPLLLLQHGTVCGYGTLEDLAAEYACNRIIELWVEGLRYDLLRQLRNHPGIIEVLLLPSSEFSGQKLRIRIQSTRYLPGLYDLVSRAPVVRVEEAPPLLKEILTHL